MQTEIDVHYKAANFNTTRPLKLYMEGRSKCHLDLLIRKEGIFVCKYASNISYNKRLVEQARKQKEFYSKQFIRNFTAPLVTDIFEGNDYELAWFEMPYVYAEKYSDYLERISVVELNNVVSQLIIYFEELSQNAKYVRPSTKVFLNKRQQLKDKLSEQPLFNQDLLHRVLDYLNHVPNLALPFGYCHGDFTLSNILFTKKGFYLIDFLDSFVESPIIDFVKLRQDTKYKWSLMLEKNLERYQTNKIIQILDYIDAKLVEHFINREWFGEWYDYLQTFNLLRILPYLNDPTEIDFIQNCLRKSIQLKD